MTKRQREKFASEARKRHQANFEKLQKSEDFQRVMRKLDKQARQPKQRARAYA